MIYMILMITHPICLGLALVPDDRPETFYHQVGWNIFFSRTMDTVYMLAPLLAVLQTILFYQSLFHCKRVQLKRDVSKSFL